MQDRLTCEVTASGSSCTTGSIKNSHTASPPFTPAGDWKTLLRPIPGTTGGKTHQFSYQAGTHRISQVNQTDGTPVLGATTYLYDARGNRSSDDNATLSNDQRSYVYDARGNVVSVVLQLQQSGQPIGTVTSAFDARNRRVFKAYQDNILGKTSHWFYYYDALDRLTEVHHVPDSSAPATKSIFQLAWLGDRLLLYWQTDYPSTTTTKRYVSTDETGRPVDMICWGPGSVDCPRVWAINPSAWGFDTVVKGATVYQPMLFSGQHKDEETIARHNDGLTVHRPALALNGFRTYDPLSGSYLQVDPFAMNSWASFVDVDSNPVMRSDTTGLMSNLTSMEGCDSPDLTAEMAWYCSLGGGTGGGAGSGPQGGGPGPGAGGHGTGGASDCSYLPSYETPYGDISGINDCVLGEEQMPEYDPSTFCPFPFICPDDDTGSPNDPCAAQRSRVAAYCGSAGRQVSGLRPWSDLSALETGGTAKLEERIPRRPLNIHLDPISPCEKAKDDLEACCALNGVDC